MLDTYNIFIDRINDYFAAPHLQIQRFEEGFYDDLGPFASENEQWPIMWIVPTNVVHYTNSVSEYAIRVYFLDRLENDDSNERDVLSDQLSISRDFTNWIRLNTTNGFDLLNNPVAIPVKSVIMDYTAGWYVDMTIEVETEGSDCTIPFSGSGPTPVSCSPAYVLNSDGSYDVEIASGGTLNLPDTSLSINGSVVESYPSVQNIAINVTLDGNPSGTWDGVDTLEITTTPANIEINGVPFDTVFGGNTLDIAVENEGGSAVGSDVAGIWEIASSPITQNGNALDSVKAEDTFPLITTLDGVPTNGTYNAGTKTLAFISNIATPKTTAFILKTGATANNGNGADGQVQSGRGASWLVMAENNMFGNTNRFTDTVGTQTYANNIILDHQSRDPLTGNLLGYDGQDVVTARTFANHLIYFATKTVAGYGNWRGTNYNELHNISRWGGVNFKWSDSPFNYTGSGKGDYLWTTTDNNIITTDAWLVFNYSTVPVQSRDKTGSYFMMGCRTFNLTSAGVLT